MENRIFQSSDLSQNRTLVLAAAREGRARVRDKDGTGLVMLPESEYDVLAGFAYWSQRYSLVSELLAQGQTRSAPLLGDLAWLRYFDEDDIHEFAEELHTALMSGLADRDLSYLLKVVEDWRVTARQLEDPLRRSVLLGFDAIGDLVEAEEPELGE